MNTLQEDKRRPRDHMAHLEYLDDRIVPSTLEPNVIAAEVATSHASVNSAPQNEESAMAESRIEIRRENRMVKIAERREKALERREKATERRETRLAQFAARHPFSPAVVVRSPVSPLTVSGSSGSTPSTSGSSSSVSGTGTGNSGSPTTPIPTLPTPTLPVTPAPGTPTPVATSPTAPLPANVSPLLDTVYEEFLNGTLPTTNQPGQVVIQGNNVGIQIHASDPSEFASIVANAESLGLQETTVSDAFDIVVGFLPIANLPAIAQLAGSSSIAPMLSPRL